MNLQDYIQRIKLWIDKQYFIIRHYKIIISVFAFMVLRSGNRARDCGNEVQRYRCDSGKELLFAYRATRSDFVFDM